MPTRNVIFDINSGKNPNLMWAKIRDKEFANGSDTGVIEQEASDPVSILRPDRLSEKEVVVAPDEPKADTDEHESDQHSSNRLRNR